MSQALRSSLLASLVLIMAWRFPALLAALLGAGNEGSSSLEKPEMAAVWRNFKALQRLPRCSGNEFSAVEYVQAIARRQALYAEADPMGNIQVWRSASSSDVREPLIVHAHLDVPCPKPGESIVDAKHLEDADYEDGWILANNSDVGAAIALALLEESSEMQLPPIEVVFTTQHEGFVGAWALNTSSLRGRQMINLNSRENRRFIVGSAGSSRVKINLPISTVALSSDARPFRVSVKSLSGGHSGLDAHLGRANALVSLARCVAVLLAKVPGSQLMSFEGGNRDDQIPSEAGATLALPLKDVVNAREAIGEAERSLRIEFAQTDPKLTVRLEQPEHAPSSALSKESADRLLDLILLLPHGPLRQDAVLGDVETSNSVARVRKASDGMLEVLCLARSSLKPALESLHDRIDRTAARVIASTSWGWEFPSWAPNRRSSLLALAQDVFRKVHGHLASGTVVHYGTEAAVLAEKLGIDDLIAYGPDVRTNGLLETVRIDSVELMWDFTKRLLAHLADTRRETNIDL